MYWKRGYQISISDLEKNWPTHDSNTKALGFWISRQNCLHDEPISIAQFYNFSHIYDYDS